MAAKSGTLFLWIIMSNQLTIQSLNKTDNDLFISGNVMAMNPTSLLIQLTDEQGQSIPCDIRTSTDRENDETSFALNAQIESHAIVFLYVSDGNQSVQLRIDPSFMPVLPLFSLSGIRAA